MARIETLQDLLVEELQDLYNAENQIIKALPKMAKRATSPDLRAAFETHLEQTHQQVARLEEAMQLLELPIKGKQCDGMRGIIEEGKQLMEEDINEAVLDAGLIAAGQRVEHYEIASYGSARTYAAMLGHAEIESLLATTLQEEEEADRTLSDLAEAHVNQDAMMGDPDEGQSGSDEEARQPGSRAAGSGQGGRPARRKATRRPDRSRTP